MMKKGSSCFFFFFLLRCELSFFSLSSSLYLEPSHRAVVEVTAEARVRMATEVMACCCERKARGIWKEEGGEGGEGGEMEK